MTDKKAAYHRRRSLSRMGALLTSLFEQAQLLTLCYAPGSSVPVAIADRQYRTLMGAARSLAGGPFRYVKVTEYGAGPAARVTAYRLILDLPPGICQEIAGRWFMGKATVEPLDARQIAAFAADLAVQPAAGGKAVGRRMWATSRGLAQRCQ